MNTSTYETLGLMMVQSTLKTIEYTQLADKLEKPAKPFDDLLIEAVGNDDGAIRDAAYRVLFCDVKDLESARQSFFDAFSDYFKCAEHAQYLIDQELAKFY